MVEEICLLEDNHVPCELKTRSYRSALKSIKEEKCCKTRSDRSALKSRKGSD
jgi:hypothetical protein